MNNYQTLPRHVADELRANLAALEAFDPFAPGAEMKFAQIERNLDAIERSYPTPVARAYAEKPVFQTRLGALRQRGW